MFPLGESVVSVVFDGLRLGPYGQVRALVHHHAGGRGLRRAAVANVKKPVRRSATSGQGTAVFYASDHGPLGNFGVSEPFPFLEPPTVAGSRESTNELQRFKGKSSDPRIRTEDSGGRDYNPQKAFDA